MSITTTEQLCDYILTNHGKSITDSQTPLEAATWFCCIQEAISASQLNTKDLANMFLSGVEGYNKNPEQSIQQWLDLYQEYCAECTAYSEEFETIEQVVDAFYNPPK